MGEPRDCFLRSLAGDMMLYTRSGLFPLYFNFINDVMKNSISKLPWLITCNDMYIKYVYRIRFFFFNIYIYMCV